MQNFISLKRFTYEAYLYWLALHSLSKVLELPLHSFLETINLNCCSSQNDRKKAQNAMDAAWKAMEKKEKIPWIKKAAEDQKRYEVQYRTVVSDQTFWPLSSHLCWRNVKMLVTPNFPPLQCRGGGVCNGCTCISVCICLVCAVSSWSWWNLHFCLMSDSTSLQWCLNVFILVFCHLLYHILMNLASWCVNCFVYIDRFCSGLSAC